MKLSAQERKGEASATMVQTLLLMLGCMAVMALFALTAAASQPGWWTSRGAVNTSLGTNDYAGVNQGQLKQFVARAVDELNADLTTNGGAGPALTNLVYGWQQDYLTNGYATNLTNPDRPYKLADFEAVNVGQLKYIASLIYSPLAGAGYTGLTPPWIQVNTNTDNVAANVGQLKQVFAWDITVAPAAPTDLVATPSNPGEIDLTWTPPVMNNARFITIEESTDGGSTWVPEDTLDDPTLESYALTGLPQGGNSMFRLFYVGSASSAPSTPTPNVQVPVAPRYAVIDFGPNFLPVGINASGIVAGNDTNGLAAVWDQGTQTALAACPNGFGKATAINASGVIVGYGKFTYNLINSDSTVDTAVETHACSWSPPYTNVVDLDAQQGDPFSDHNHWAFLDGWVSQALAVSDSGATYGFQSFQSADQPMSFTSNAAPVASNVRSSWDPIWFSDVGSRQGGHILGAAGTNWCGYYNVTFSNSAWTNGCIVNDQIIPVPWPYSYNSDIRATAINTNGVAVGYLGTQPIQIISGAITNLPGTGAAAAINDLFTTNITSGGTVTNVVATPQIVGTDGTGTNALIWDYTQPNGTPSTTIVQGDLNQLTYGASPTGTGAALVHVGHAFGININGIITAVMTQISDGTQRGGLHQPCQFVLLNGNQSGTDGVNFDGTRPTKISDVSDDPKTSEAITDLGTNQLGPVLGSSYGGGNGYVNSLIVAAKVAPATATGVTYSWDRKYQDRSWAITQSADGIHWDVTQVNSLTGFPTPHADNSAFPGDTTSNRTITPSPMNVLYWYDSPGEKLTAFNLGEGGIKRIGDYAYEETIFTYTLTITIGSASTTSVVKVGQRILACRQAINGTTSEQWQPKYNLTSTSNPPDCVLTKTKVQGFDGDNRRIDGISQANGN